MNKKLKKKSLLAVTGIMTAILIVVIFVTWRALERYEQGIIDVCATQQDSYVQLVVDQINLKENRSNEEIVQNILSTMDASTNRYWVFSQDQALLFVKDTLETNKYQSFKTDYYYTEKSSAAFVNSLRLNVVQHADIIVNDKEYVASGVKFNYGGKEYKMCLLTNRSVLLDNNYFLGAKVEFCVLLFGVYFLLYIIPIIAVSAFNRLVGKLEDSEKENSTLNGKLVKLNHKLDNVGYEETPGALVDKRIEDIQQDMFDISYAPDFISRMNDSTYPVGFSLFAYADDEGRKQLASALNTVLDKRDVRFEDKENGMVAIISMKCDTAKLRTIGDIDTDSAYLGSDIINLSDHSVDVYRVFRNFIDIKSWSVG